MNNARVGVNFSTGGWSPKNTHKDRFTNSKGRVTVSGQGIGRIGYTVFYDGYYTTSEVVDFDEMDVSKRRFLPWNREITVKMRRIGERVPMYAKRVITELPVLDKPVGYDLMAGDWVSPYGKGQVSDFVFFVTKRYANELDFDGELRLSFSNEFDGIYAYPKDLLFPSGLILPSFAPEKGYINHVDKYHRRLPGKYYEDNYDEKQHYYFRVRSVAENGKLKKAMYGKIYRDINFGVNDRKTAIISFNYYLNPDYSRNVEFDLNRNFLNEEAFYSPREKPKAN